MKILNYTRETIQSMGVSERNFPKFKSGDTIKVTLKILEGNKERLQDFEGVVISMGGVGISKTFTVRKITEGISIERIFPYYSPVISDIKFIQGGIVRRAKLYYIRDRKGKAAQVERKKQDGLKVVKNESIQKA